MTSTVSHETIYNAIYTHGDNGLGKSLHKCLHRRHRCRKHRRQNPTEPTGTGPLGLFNPIGIRPPEANKREKVGHLEGDLICGAFNRSAIVTVFDRASRRVWLARFLADHGAQATCGAMTELLERIPEHLRLTLTWDQGREMAQHDQLSKVTGIDIYFADPHSPWQRPTNENGNGLLRRYVGKGTNLATYTNDDLRRIENRLNTMPRRSLHWLTANDVYNEGVALTA